MCIPAWMCLYCDKIFWKIDIKKLHWYKLKFWPLKLHRNMFNLISGCINKVNGNIWIRNRRELGNDQFMKALESFII